MRRELAFLIGSLLLPTGCGKAPPTGGGQHDLATIPIDMSVPGRVYQFEKVTGCGQGGYQSQIALAPDNTTVGIVTIAATTRTGSCAIMGRPNMSVPYYDICFGESKAGAAFTTSTVDSVGLIALTGVALAYSPAGVPNVAYTGNANGVASAQFRCGASNLLVADPTSGQFSPKTIATSSQSAALVPDQMSACIQNICNLGDAVGYWPAIAFSPTTQQAGFAYRDIHYGFATDDFASSDVEYTTLPGLSILTVDVSRGGGTYSHLAYKKTGEPVILQYNADGEGVTNPEGLWINQDTGGGTWAAAQISTAKVGEMLGFGISPSGTYSLAYYDANALKLEYMESTDGMTWGSPVDVDTDGNTGQNPSLAFDAGGNPVIAYYRCNDYDPNVSSCDQDKDGLRIARREGTTWTVESVTGQTGIFDGLYAAITFVNGKAVVGYQVRTYDPGSNTNMVELDVAREQ